MKKKRNLTTQQYCDLILEQVQKQLKLTPENLQYIQNRLKNGTEEELKQLYKAIEKYGTAVILENISKYNILSSKTQNGVEKI